MIFPLASPNRSNSLEYKVYECSLRKGLSGKLSVPTAATLDPCCICLQTIGPKDEVLFCLGKCQKYLHCYCTNVSESSYKTLTSEGAPPFLCYKAQKDNQLSSETEKLKAEMNTLKTTAAAS